MRKYIISVSLILSFSFFVNAQSWEEDMVVARKKVDSLKQELKSAKGDNRIDCLNQLAVTYYWIWDEDDKVLDTACLISEQVYELAKKSNYKKGLGYATMLRAHCFAGRTDNNLNNNNSETNYMQAEKWAQQAIKVGEEIKDNKLIVEVYNILIWMERWRGSTVRYKEYIEKAIFHYEKAITEKTTAIQSNSTCDQCKELEKELGSLYQRYAQILNSEGKDFSIVKEQINKAIFYYSKIDNKWGQAVAYHSLGQLVSQTINLEAGVEYLSKAVVLSREANNISGELNVLRDLCSTYWNMGDFENGLNAAKRSLTLAEKQIKTSYAGSADSLRLEQTYYWMARFYEIAGDYSTAFDYFNKARIFLPADGAYQTPLMVALGELHRKAGNYDSAKVYLMQFEKRDGGKPMLANLYVSLKQYDDALRILNLARELPVNRNNPLGRGRMFLVSANAYLGKNNFDQALTNARQAIALIVQMKRNVYLPDGYKVLSDIFDKIGKTDSAFYYFKKYSSLKDSLLNRQFYFRLSDYKKEVEEAKKEARIGFLDRDNKIKEQQLKQQASFKNSLVISLLLLIFASAFIVRSLLLKRKNDKLKSMQLENELKMQQLENEKRQTEFQKKTTELEMQALRAQMNPHFIFNCLSSINRFILKNEPDTASDYLTRFSRLIRMVLINSQKSLITLEDELDMLTIYLDMERLRFKNNFDYHIVFTNRVDAGAIYIPPLLLQPFCENAIWHGLKHLADPQSGRHEHGRLDIVLSIEDKVLHCSITDNGIGRQKAAEIKSKSAEENKSMGLKITSERLALLNQQKENLTSFEIIDLKNERGEIAGTSVKLKIFLSEPVEELA